MLKRLYDHASLEERFLDGYRKNYEVMEGIGLLIETFDALYPYESRGYRFLVGNRPTKRDKGNSPYKRWHMFLRWMVREDNIDMGLWKKVSKSDLLMPLDTHTFHVAKSLKLLKRKQYDLCAVKELTQTLKTFDPLDPIKYDFSLYRLGQEKIISK